MKRIVDCLAVSITLLLVVGLIAAVARVSFFIFSNEIEPTLGMLLGAYWTEGKTAAAEVWNAGRGWPIVALLAFCVLWTVDRAYFTARLIVENSGNKQNYRTAFHPSADCDSRSANLVRRQSNARTGRIA